MERISGKDNVVGCVDIECTVVNMLVLNTSYGMWNMLQCCTHTLSLSILEQGELVRTYPIRAFRL